METLVEIEDEDGDYVAVTLDPEDETVFVQYNFVTFTLSRDEFEGLSDALDRATEALPEP